jgi:hypothetical protein
MYRNCIFCSADLKANDALERFPVGRSIAFDSEKGRLWAVCPQCARWNLAPIEERWEAIEDAERLFRDTRTRVQSENVGLAKVRGGTRLIRIGQAVPGELAAWRYGGELGKRRRRYVIAGVGTVLTAAVITGSFATGILGAGPLIQLVFGLGKKALAPDEIQRFPRGTASWDGNVVVDRKMLLSARLVADPRGGDGIALLLPTALWGTVRRPDGQDAWGNIPVTLTGSDAHSVLRRGMVRVNASGASRRGIGDALGLLSPAGAGGYLHGAAAAELPLADPRLPDRERRARLLALEMALHEETERRALDGELAALEEMWRQAEGIAAIADRLPDVSAAVPPRI